MFCKTRSGALLAVSVLLLMLVAVVAGCGDPETQDPVPSDPEPGGRLVIGWPDEPDTLDPHKTTAGASHFIMDKISGPYLLENPDTGEFEPVIFESWESSEDGTTWTFTIRPGITFHSGRPLTAEDVKATWDRAMDPATQTVSADVMLGPIEKVEVIDELTLRVTHSQPFGPFFYGIAELAGYTHTIDPDALAEYGEDYGRNPSSYGPWIFEEWATGSHILLRRNPDYNWPAPFFDNQGPVYPEELMIKFIPEDATRMAALEVGEIDIATVPLTEIDRFLDEPGFEIHEYLAQGLTPLWLNTQHPPLDDVLVRRAINHAINRDPIIDAALEGHGVEARGPVAPTIWGYSEEIEEVAYDFNRDRAGELLDEAGWRIGSDGTREKDGETLELSLYIWPSDPVRRTSEIVQAQLRDIGVTVHIESFEFGTMLEYLFEGRHDMTIVGYGYGDPDLLYLYFHSSQIGAGANFTFYSTPELDEIVEAQRYTADPEERAALVAEAQRMIVEKALWAPLYVPTAYVAVNERVRGFEVSPRTYWMMQDVWLVRD